MSTPTVALTHHAILALVAPFSRAGRRLDLAASDRLRRRLVFAPVERPAAGALPALSERLQLDCPPGGAYRLTRTLTHAGGTVATLELHSASIGALLQALDAIGPARQLIRGHGYVAARHDRLYVDAAAPARKLHPVLAIVQLETVALQVTFPRVAGLPALLELVGPHRVRATLPDDVLAVMGWDWSPLRERNGALEGSVRLRGRDLDRAATAVLQTAGRQLARAFAEGPRRFRERLAMRRLGVALRRAIPSVAFTAMALEIVFADLLRAARGSVLALLLVALPVALLALYFMRCQGARFELPRWPQ